MEKKILLLLLLLISFVWPVTDISKCMVINQPGEYVLAKDLKLSKSDVIDWIGTDDICFYLNSSNISIDLNGHTIDCSAIKPKILQSGSRTNGFYLFSISTYPMRRNITLKNGKISGCKQICDVPFDKINNISTIRSGCIPGIEITNSIFINGSGVCLYYKGDGKIFNNLFENDKCGISCTCSKITIFRTMSLKIAK